MPFPVTLYTVRITSPSDVEIEAGMACDVLRDWNAAHALADRIVLLPLGDGAADGAPDILIAFLQAAPGAPMELGNLGREIEAHLARKRPAFIYFSEARVALTHPGEIIEREFKNHYADHAVVDCFNDEKEFRSKFARQLEATVRSHSSFRAGIGEGASPLPPLDMPRPDEPKPAPAELSEEAQKLLIIACQDPEAYIGRHRDGNVLKLQANGEQLVKPGDPAATARWESAFQEVLDGGYIRDAGCHGRLFQISAQGFEHLRTLGHVPIGYIAELGSV